MTSLNRGGERFDFVVNADKVVDDDTEVTPGEECKCCWDVNDEVLDCKHVGQARRNSE